MPTEASSETGSVSRLNGGSGKLPSEGGRPDPPLPVLEWDLRAGESQPVRRCQDENESDGEKRRQLQALSGGARSAALERPSEPSSAWITRGSTMVAISRSRPPTMRALQNINREGTLLILHLPQRM